MASPYPWHYTIRWPIYYRWPSTKNHTRLQPFPDKYVFKKTNEQQLRLLFCGDIMVQDNDVAPILHPELCALIQSADLFVGNCEAPVGNHLPQKIDYNFIFHMPRTFLENIIDQTGLASNNWVLSTANNHAGDKDNDAFLATYDIFSELNITALGRYNEPVKIIERAGIRIGFAAWTNWLNREIFTTPSIYRTHDILEINWKSLKTKHRLDYLFGLPHWEYEFQHYPRKKTQQLADSLLTDNAFDFLVGSHTHTLQPMEWFNNKFCAYNLGNFCGFAKGKTVKLISLLEVKLSKAGVHSYCYHYFYQAQINGKTHIIPVHLAPRDEYLNLENLINKLFYHEKISL